MKVKFIFSMLAPALILAACNKPQVEPEQPEEIIPSAITAVAQEMEILDINGTHTGTEPYLWTKADSMSVFKGKVSNSKYVLTGQGGESTVNFNLIASGTLSQSMTGSKNLALFPYDDAYFVSASDDTHYGIKGINIPSDQSRDELPLMVAIADGDQLEFRCPFAILEFGYYGDNPYYNMVLTAKGGESLAGPSELTIDEDGTFSLDILGHHPQIHRYLDEHDSDETIRFIVYPGNYPQGLHLKVSGRKSESSKTIPLKEIKPGKIYRCGILAQSESEDFILEEENIPISDSEIWFKVPTGQEPVDLYDHFIRKDKVLGFYKYVRMDGKPVTEIPTLQFWDFKLTSVLLPGSLEKIGSRAFVDIETLSEIGIQVVKSIGSGAFRNTGLIQILLPEGLEEIGSSAFDSCSDLSFISIPSTLKRWEESSFSKYHSFDQIIFNLPPTAKNEVTGKQAESFFIGSNYSHTNLILTSEWKNAEESRRPDLENKTWCGKTFKSISYKPDRPIE